jgi:hypothetical protein
MRSASIRGEREAFIVRKGFVILLGNTLIPNNRMLVGLVLTSLIPLDFTELFPRVGGFNLFQGFYEILIAGYYQ